MTCCVVIPVSPKNVADPPPSSDFDIFWHRWRTNGCLALHLTLSLASVSLIFAVGISLKNIQFILIN